MTNHYHTPKQPDKPEQGANTPFPALRFDPEAYRDYVASLNLSEAQERAYLEALWRIIVSFVDLAFGIHPVQQAMDAKTLDVDSPDVVPSIDSLNINDDLHAAIPEGRDAGRKDS